MTVDVADVVEKNGFSLDASGKTTGMG